MIITIRAGSSPVSRTKALKTQRFRGFFLFSFAPSEAKLRARFCARFSGGNLVGRIKMKQVEGFGNVTVETAIEEFLKNCRLRNLSPKTIRYYEEDLQYFARNIPANPSCKQTHLLFQYGKVRYESEAPTVYHGAFGYQRNAECLHPCAVR